MERNAALHLFIAELSKVIGGLLGAAILGETITQIKRIIFFGIFAALDLVAGIIAYFLEKPIFQPKKSPTTKEILKGSWRLITSKDMWLLMVTFSYTGWLEAYEVGTYGAKVAYTRAFTSVLGKKAGQVLIRDSGWLKSFFACCSSDSDPLLDDPGGWGVHGRPAVRSAEDRKGR